MIDLSSIASLGRVRWLKGLYIPACFRHILLPFLRACTHCVLFLVLCCRNDLSDAAVRAVVPALTGLTALTSLELQGLHLTAPPPGVLQMKGLKYLGLGLGYYNQVGGERGGRQSPL